METENVPFGLEGIDLRFGILLSRCRAQERMDEWKTHTSSDSMRA
jgi:hypothetical protein